MKPLWHQPTRDVSRPDGTGDREFESWSEQSIRIPHLSVQAPSFLSDICFGEPARGLDLSISLRAELHVSDEVLASFCLSKTSLCALLQKERIKRFGERVGALRALGVFRVVGGICWMAGNSLLTPTQRFCVGQSSDGCRDTRSVLPMGYLEGSTEESPRQIA